MPLAQFTLVATLACSLAAIAIQPGGNLDAYLTKDGQLSHALEIRDTQGGFAGFTGTYYKVEPNGTWSMGKVFQQKLTEEKNGMVGKQELTRLAQALAKFDLATLSSQGKQGTNPHVVSVKFGKVDATLSLPTAAPLPKVDPNAKKLAGEQRFTGIIEAVKEAMKLDPNPKR
jgi:hypothetical protein